MKRFLHAVLRGQPLRHRPIALPLDEQRQVRVVLERPGRDWDVSCRVFPAALNPFIIGLAPGPSSEPLHDSRHCRLRFEDAAGSIAISGIVVEAGQTLATAEGPIALLRPIQSAVRCVPAAYRAWRHFLAWRHTRAGGRTAHNLQMSYADLRALNAFYVLPRPVFLVSVAAGDRSNMFPMDLVAPIGGDRFLLALRRTSPSVDTMCASRQVVVSGAPAPFKDIAYRLGAHHKKPSIDWDTLPFALVPSTVYGIPRPLESPIVRELQIEASDEIGSHMLFRCRIIRQEAPSGVPQLCHVSDMYARWRHRQGRAFADA
jgi:flavin reductase (DIM6/NTAB) family NADH-FMN oxidoreductase RutF